MLIALCLVFVLSTTFKYHCSASYINKKCIINESVKHVCMPRSKHSDHHTILPIKLITVYKNSSLMIMPYVTMYIRYAFTFIELFIHELIHHVCQYDRLKIRNYMLIMFSIRRNICYRRIIIISADMSTCRHIDISAYRHIDISTL